MKNPPTRTTARPSRRTAGISVGAILAIIVLIAVAIFAWVLLRDGGTPEPSQQAEEQTTELQQDLDAAEARAQLNGLRSAIESDIDEEALRQQYDAIRADFESAYEGASGQAAETWSELEEDLDQLGDQLTEEGDEAVQTIDRMLTNIGE